jgi:hypothetical protein
MTNRIKELNCDDDGMWSWTFIDNDEDTTVRMRTSDGGEGIWAFMPSNCWTVDSDGNRRTVYEWRQQIGTGQFSLYGCSDSAARHRILREFSE